jgi:hypothetical protein
MMWKRNGITGNKRDHTKDSFQEYDTVFCATLSSQNLQH